MGYYIDLVFDSTEQLDCEAVIEKFRRLGARRLPDVYIGPAANDYVHMLFPDFGYPIWVFRRESEQQKGNWADIRLSWGEAPAGFMQKLGYILELADKIGCRVYDGQNRAYLTKVNLEKVRSAFSKDADIVIGMFGASRRR